MKKKNPPKKTSPKPIPEEQTKEETASFEANENTFGTADTSDTADTLGETSDQGGTSVNDAVKAKTAIFTKNGRLSFYGYIAVVAFGILLYWALHHFSVIAGGIGTVIGFAKPLIAGLAIAFVINAVLSPLEVLWDRIFKKSRKITARIKRPICLVLSTIIVVGVVTAIIFMLIPELKSTASTFASKLPTFLAKLEAFVASITELLSRVGFTFEEIEFNADKILEELTSFVKNEGKNVFDSTVSLTTSIFSSIFNTILAVVFAFYVLAQKEKVGGRLRTILYALTPKRFADRTVSTLSLASRIFSKFLTGQLTEAIIIGILCFIGMLILRLPYAAVISVLIGATALIPMFGAFIGTALGAVLILSESLVQAIWFIVFIIILQQLESNLIYPRVVGKSLGLPGILVLASLTVGGAMFGFVGILVSVPVCSVMYSLFNEFVEKRIK